MKYQFFIFSIIIPLFFIPTAYAQISGNDINQKSVEVVINSNGEVQVTHVIGKLKEPYRLDLIKGNSSNLTVTDIEGNDKAFGVMDVGSILIFPSQGDTIVKYDLFDGLIFSDNIWTWNFRYLESTSFILPDELDLIYVNDRPVNLGEKKGINCHGCEMVLQYSIGEPKFVEKIKISKIDYSFGFRTWAKITNFNFNPELEGLNFQVEGDNSFVATIIPLDFLVEPYQVFLNDEKIFFQKYFNNGTHVGINFKPQTSGDVIISGVVIPEIENEDNFPFGFLIIIPAVVGLTLAYFVLKRKKK